MPGWEGSQICCQPIKRHRVCCCFASLEYQIKPPKDFSFVKRNIHFATACRQSAKRRLSDAVRKRLGPALPNANGMVWISSSPPSHRDIMELPSEERYVEVPAACLSESGSASAAHSLRNLEGLHQGPIPMVAVAVDQPFAASGNGVASQRTVNHVGFNGISFRGANGY